MNTVATCRGSILRGTTENEFGDLEDNSTVAASGVLARLKTTRSVVQDSATQTPRVITSTQARMPSNTDIRPGDRFRDDTNGGTTYAVLDVTQPDTQGHKSDLDVLLRQVTPAE